MHAPAIFIPSDSAFIFITVINMAKWIFLQFLANPLCIVSVINTWLCKHGDGGDAFEECCRGFFTGAEAWIISLNAVGGGDTHFLKYFFGARHCNELPAAVYRKLLCVCALCNPFQCIRRSKAAAETCLVE